MDVASEAGDPRAHPYKTGADWVPRYITVTQNCAQASKLKLERLSGQAR